MDSIYDQGDEAPTKKVRHRKKQFLKTIRKQMEFYFSDANLSKNRYLGQLVSKDPQVDLTIFLSFNKIRESTMDLDDIKKAVKKSDMLALTEDGAKVYRKTRVRHNENADESTIYVEQLPPDSDHEWLKSVFLPYGDVPYVSIPKYPHNGLNKGFAFVEFDCPESATRALEAFGAMGCRLTADVPPEQICSIKQNITSHGEGTSDVVEPNFKVPVGADSVEKKSDTETEEPRKSEQSDSTKEERSNDQEEETKSKPVKKRKISLDSDNEPEEKSMRGEEGRAKKTKVKRETEEETESEKKGTEHVESAEKEAGKRRKVKVEVEDQDVSDRDVEGGLKSPESDTKPGKKRKMKKTQDEAEEPVKEAREEEGDERVPKKRRKEIKEEPVEAPPEEEGDERVSKKRRKEIKEEPVEEATEEEGDGKVSKKRRKEIKEEPDDPVAEMETEASENKDSKDDEKENDEVRKKKRSRNHKKKSKKEKAESEPKMSLRVLSKSEWKRLRNKYLDLQKAKMSQLKQQLYRSRWGGGSQERNPPRATEVEPVKTEPVKNEKKFTFTPGVIVRLRFTEPPADVKKFKTDAKVHAEVKYVDAREGWNEAYIRCSTAEAANQMLAQQTWSQMDILTGVEETAYWEKMDRDREVQCGRNERVKVRGKAKLLAKVERAAGKHIRFAAEDEEEGGPRG